MIQKLPPAKTGQMGRTTLRLPPPQGRVTKTPPAKTGKMGRTTLCLPPPQELFQQKTDQMGRTTFSLSTPQGTKKWCRTQTHKRGQAVLIPQCCDSISSIER